MQEVFFKKLPGWWSEEISRAEFIGLQYVKGMSLIYVNDLIKIKIFILHDQRNPSRPS